MLDTRIFMGMVITQIFMKTFIKAFTVNDIRFCLMAFTAPRACLINQVFIFHCFNMVNY